MLHSRPLHRCVIYYIESDTVWPPFPLLLFVGVLCVAQLPTYLVEFPEVRPMDADGSASAFKRMLLDHSTVGPLFAPERPGGGVDWQAVWAG
jgi:hypothetical protein